MENNKKISHYLSPQIIHTLFKILKIKFDKLFYHIYGQNRNKYIFFESYYWWHNYHLANLFVCETLNTTYEMRI